MCEASSSSEVTDALDKLVMKSIDYCVITDNDRACYVKNT